MQGVEEERILIMEKKNIDWGNLGFGYMETEKRFVSNYKDGAWDIWGQPALPHSQQHRLPFHALSP